MHLQHNAVGPPNFHFRSPHAAHSKADQVFKNKIFKTKIMASSSLRSSKSSIYGSLKSSKSNSIYGSLKSNTTSNSIYGSLKSSKSSNTIFGSCLSTTDTIGSFRTAFSGSLSTLYFSAKSSYSANEDTNTLNWTMNYDNFDELSDTSTLVGEELEEDFNQVQSGR